MNIDLRKVPWGTVITAATLAVGIGATFVRAESQINANTAEIADQSESIDELEDEIATLQRRLLEQSSDNKEALAEIRTDLKHLLRLLEGARQ